jgi:hypothetical protein
MCSKWFKELCLPVRAPGRGAADRAMSGCTPVIPAAQEAEAGVWLESRISRPDLATSETLSQNKTKQKQKKEESTDTEFSVFKKADRSPLTIQPGVWLLSRVNSKPVLE